MTVVCAAIVRNVNRRDLINFTFNVIMTSIRVVHISHRYHNSCNDVIARVCLGVCVRVREAMQ